MSGMPDASIIGAGQTGPSPAVRLTSARTEMAILERHVLGGARVNTGCDPTVATHPLSGMHSAPILGSRQAERAIVQLSCTIICPPGG